MSVFIRKNFSRLVPAKMVMNLGNDGLYFRPHTMTEAVNPIHCAESVPKANPYMPRFKASVSVRLTAILTMTVRMDIHMVTLEFCIPRNQPAMTNEPSIAGAPQMSVMKYSAAMAAARCSTSIISSSMPHSGVRMIMKATPIARATVSA